MARNTGGPAGPSALFFSYVRTAVALTLLGATAARPGTFTVAPVSATFPPGVRTASLSVTNEGSTEALMQLEVFDWTQADGADALEPAVSLIAAPPVFTLPAGQTQVVRVALRKDLPRDRESAFRLFISEVPTQQGPGGTVAVAMRLGIPIFVSPAALQRNLAWTVERESEGRVRLKVRNEGNVHAQVGRVKLLRCGAEKATLYEGAIPDYVFPGQSRSWSLEVGAPVPDPATCPLTLRRESPDGKQEVLLPPETATKP